MPPKKKPGLIGRTLRPINKKKAVDKLTALDNIKLNVSDEESDISDPASDMIQKRGQRITAVNSKTASPEASVGSESSDSDETDSSSDDSSSLHQSAKPKPKPKPKPKQTTKSRGPGRPRKNPVVEALPLLGVVKKPQSAKNKMEMMYGNPGSLKKIFTLLKVMEPERIHIYFEKDKFTIKARDHLDKSDIYVECFGSRLHRYFCEKPFAISLEPNSVAKVFQLLKNNHHCIKFISRKRSGDDVNIFIVFTNRIRDQHFTYEVQVKGNSDFTGKNDSEVNLGSYPINFTMESKEFKETVSGFALHKLKKFTIQKKGGSDFRITTNASEETGVTCSYVYKNEDEIKLNSRVEKGDLFSSAINIRYIKNFSKTILGDKLCIYADRIKPTVFVTELDGEEDDSTFRVTVITEAFRYKTVK